MKTQKEVSLEINSNAPVKYRETVTIKADREKVWSILTGINDWSKWQTEIKSAQLEGDPVPGNSFTWHSGGTRIRSRIHTHIPSSRFGWTGGMPGLRAVHNWTLENKDGQTVVKVEESMEGLIARMLRSMLNRTLEKSLLTWLNLLRKQSETTTRFLVSMILLIGLTTAALAQAENSGPKSLSVGMQLSQYQQDFGMGFNLTSPFFGFYKVAVRLKYNYMWHEHMDSDLHMTWSGYSSLRTGILGIELTPNEHTAYFFEMGASGIPGITDELPTRRKYSNGL